MAIFLLFSNKGPCVNIYTLGEDVLGFSGTGVSSALVSSSVALYLEKYRRSSVSQVLQFLKNNSMNVSTNYILKIPHLTNEADLPQNHTYYSLRDMIIFIAAILLVLVLLWYLIKYLLKERSLRESDEFVFRSLDEEF